MGTGGLLGRQTYRDPVLIHYGGLVAQRPHSASAIGAIVSDYFRVPAKVIQFAGQWLSLDENVTKLGSAFSQLGVSTIAGTRVWDAQSKIRIKIGPMPFEQFQEFVPAGPAYPPCRDLVRLMTGLEVDFDFQLVLEAPEVPNCVLGRIGSGPRLGWTSWLKTREFSEDDEQVVLQVNDGPSEQ
jgi:type VI secretion system protein ImpH